MLKYIGGGFLPGVPARNLTREEALQYGGVSRLVASGLYRLERSSKPKPEENKLAGPGLENKEND